MSYKNLEYALRMEGVTHRQVADILGISDKTFYNKIHGKNHFTLDEYKKICTMLPKYGGEWLFKEFRDNASEES